MKYIKGIMCGIISFGVVKILFHGSIMTMIFVFFLLYNLLHPKNEETANPNNSNMVIVIGLCLLGGGCVWLGKLVIQNDELIILGASVFSVTLATILVRASMTIYQKRKSGKDKVKMI